MPNSTNPGGTSASASDGPRRSGRVLAKAIRDEEEKKKGGEKRKREEEEEEEGDDEEHCGVDDDDDEYGKRPRKRVNKGKAPARKAPKGKAPAIQPTKPKAGASGPTKRTTDSPNEPSTPEYVQSEADTSANSPTPAGTSNDEASLSKFDAAKRRFPVSFHTVLYLWARLTATSREPSSMRRKAVRGSRSRAE